MFMLALIVLVFVVPPVLYVRFLMSRGAVSGFHLLNRSERFRPMKFMVVNTALGMFIFSRVESPPLVLDVVLACLVALLAVYSITLYYKISAHSAAVSSLSVVLILLYGWAAAPFLAFIPLVSWARVRMAVHTTPQVVSGSLLGFSITFAVLKLKGHF